MVHKPFREKPLYTMMEKRGKNPHYNNIVTIHKYAYGKLL